MDMGGRRIFGYQHAIVARDQVFLHEGISPLSWIGIASQIPRLHAEARRSAALSRALLARHNLREAGQESGSESCLRRVAQGEPESEGRSGGHEACVLKVQGSRFNVVLLYLLPRTFYLEP